MVVLPIVSKDSRMKDNDSYVFIANPLTIDFNLPFEIAGNHYLDKANDSQLQRIQEYLSNTGHSILQEAFEGNKIEKQLKS